MNDLTHRLRTQGCAELVKDEAAKEIERLRAALSEAIDMVQDWGGYASEYFQQKHDLPGQVAKLRGYLDGQSKPPAPQPDHIATTGKVIEPEEWEVARDYVRSVWPEAQHFWCNGIQDQILLPGKDDLIGEGKTQFEAWTTAALNIAQGKVWAKWPGAICGTNGLRYIIFRSHSDRTGIDEGGGTELAAWIDAAKRVEGGNG